jgi:hypothetical protein
MGKSFTSEIAISFEYQINGTKKLVSPALTPLAKVCENEIPSSHFEVCVSHVFTGC